jgi:putative oxidoreductase
MDSIAVGLLIARLIVGLGFASHGAQKIFGWFGGYGIKGTGQFFEGLGFRPGALFALGAGLGELGGGLLTALGFLGAVGPALMIMVMLVAIFTVHVKNGFAVAKNGWEFPAIYGSAALAFAFGGFGAYSIDHAIGLTVLNGAISAWALMAAAVVLALLNLAARRPAQQPAQQREAEATR